MFNIIGKVKIALNEVKIFTLDSFSDFRGTNTINFDNSVATEFFFCVAQINTGLSEKPFTLRGLHYQKSPHEQAKLVSCLHGAIFNVAVNIRKESPTYGRITTAILSSENHQSMYIPKGYAHGYLTLEPNTLMQWCVDVSFCNEAAQCLKWDSCGIDWPGNKDEYTISVKDKNGVDMSALV